jgi:hypothetical protein
MSSTNPYDAWKRHEGADPTRENMFAKLAPSLLARIGRRASVAIVVLGTALVVALVLWAFL